MRENAFPVRFRHLIFTALHVLGIKKTLSWGGGVISNKSNDILTIVRELTKATFNLNSLKLCLYPENNIWKISHNLFLSLGFLVTFLF